MGLQEKLDHLLRVYAEMMREATIMRATLDWALGEVDARTGDKKSLSERVKQVGCPHAAQPSHGCVQWERQRERERGRTGVSTLSRGHAGCGMCNERTRRLAWREAHGARATCCGGRSMAPIGIGPEKTLELC